jgi:hypothetical protein
MKLLKNPLFHFITGGILLYLLYAFFSNYLNREEKLVLITSSEIIWMEDSWQKRWNRPPTPDERIGLIDQLVKEKVLYKTAVEIGLDKDDMVIRRRMVQKIEFLGADLIQPPLPSESDLIGYFDKRREEYALPETVTMTHIYFDPDKREDKTLEDANEALQKLGSIESLDGDLSGYGDPFMLQSYYPNKSETEIRKLFGSGFAESIFQLEPGKWHGPVLSGYGTHLVFVHEHVVNELPAFEMVREKVKEDWIADIKKELEDSYIEGLLDRYEIIVENE